MINLEVMSVCEGEGREDTYEEGVSTRERLKVRVPGTSAVGVVSIEVGVTGMLPIGVEIG